MNIKVNPDICTLCRLCESECPVGAVEIREGRVFIDRETCTYCGACVEACPPGAITIEREHAAEAMSADELSAYRDVWVFAEQRGGRLVPVTFELLNEGASLARSLGQRLAAVYIGAEEEHIEELFRRGAQVVYAAVDDSLASFRDDLYADILTDFCRRHKPAIVLAGATLIGRAFVPRVAARLRTGLTADCTGLEIDPESSLLRQTRPTFGGNLMATILCEERRPQMATVRPRTFDEAPPGDKPAGSELVRLDISGFRTDGRLKTLEVIPGSDEIDLTDAEVIVSGGRGIGKPEGFKMLRELAELLGGVVGSSRAAVDAGWISYPHQVGQTGKTVKPRVYIACGISGAIQHLAGMGTSDTVIAINKDREAPIFRSADYGLVGDVYEIIPALVKQIKAGER